MIYLTFECDDFCWSTLSHYDSHVCQYLSTEAANALNIDQSEVVIRWAKVHSIYRFGDQRAPELLIRILVPEADNLPLLRRCGGIVHNAWKILCGFESEINRPNPVFSDNPEVNKSIAHQIAGSLRSIQGVNIAVQSLQFCITTTEAGVSVGEWRS